MPRLLLSDEHWSKLREILLHKAIYNKRDLRMTVEGMLYRMRTGCPWRDLPKEFGNWNKVYKRFNAWSAAGKWFKVFKMLVEEPDMEWVFIDGSYAKAHQHSAGAASANDEAIGKSRAGNTSKIHLAVDAHGLPIEFEITGGQINDCTQAPALISKLPAAETIVADVSVHSTTYWTYFTSRRGLSNSGETLYCFVPFSARTITLLRLILVTIPIVKPVRLSKVTFSPTCSRLSACRFS